LQLFCCFDRREFSIKTVHLSPRLQGFTELNAISANSFLLIYRVLACSSMKTLCPPHRPCSFQNRHNALRIEIYFESCPPISKIVSTSGLSLSSAALRGDLIFYNVRPDKICDHVSAGARGPTPQIRTLPQPHRLFLQVLFLPPRWVFPRS